MTAVIHTRPQHSRALIVCSSPTDAFRITKVATQLFDQVMVVAEMPDLELAFQGYRPDVVIMDISVDQAGTNCQISSIRGRADDLSITPIIVVSSDPGAEAAAMARSKGAGAHVSKPVKLEDVENAVKTLCIGWPGRPVVQGTIRQFNQVTRAMIVEDSPTDAYLAGKIAAGLFNEVLVVSNASELEKTLPKFRPDVIFMDVMLGEWENGFSLIAEIRSRVDDLATVPFVVISSKDTDQDKAWAAKQGAGAYVVKPATEEAIEEAVKAVVVGWSGRPAKPGTILR